MSEQLAKANKRTVGKLLLLIVGMFGFGFALVPLYDLFCDVTGLNGKTGVADAKAVAASRVDTSRWVTVEFTSQVNGLTLGTAFPAAVSIPRLWA